MMQAYSTYINGLDLRDYLTAFAAEVEEKNYEKMPYYMWRDLNRFTSDYDSIRIGWSYGSYNVVNIDLFIDSANNKNPEQAYKFVRGDNSFGDYLYEYFLFHLENDMKVKEAAPEWQVYEATNPIAQHYNDLKNAGRLGVSYVSEKCDVIINNKNNKESNVMKFNFDFGPVNPSTVRMSLYGLAVKNKAGTWVSYDAKAGDIMDVDILNFDGAKFLYKMPVATKDITIGDVVIHNGIPMFVIAIATNGIYITAVDPINGERKDIMLPKSPFGFNFATKVVNFLGNTFNASATAENPFGNMWMLMAMSGENKDMNDILPFLMMNNATPGIDNNVLMFMALSNTKDGSKDMLPWLLMSQTMNAAPAHECKCGGNCSHASDKE